MISISGIRDSIILRRSLLNEICNVFLTRLNVCKSLKKQKNNKKRQLDKESTAAFFYEETQIHSTNAKVLWLLSSDPDYLV